MEEELAKALQFARQAENTQQKPAMVSNIGSTPMQMTKIFGGANDAKRMSFDESMPQYSTSPLSSFLSHSPGGTQYPGGYNPARRDSLKNMWTTQDFGTMD
ncbi:uncharacterized protein LOC118438662 isoform X1 [Folsomia candida]|uniref:uncharacterized protein LOC118438662 isoform X1 n=1 Tax=Folsomia candida TaxID=158441 RepID=UPI001604FB94|nr:uncharacterized protein LOC118438662 isoform X1 [Folsomia candida]